MKDTATLLSELTLLEKAALLSGANTWQTRAIEHIGLPAVWLADGPHGVRKQVGSADHLGINGSEPATCFPTAATLACSWDDELAEQIGAALGAEASAQGVGVLLGPGLNIKRSPLGGRNFEYFSEDPELSGRLAAAYVRGIQSAGVAATPKHFAVNSQELRRMVSDSVVDERTLREIYLTAFEIVVREAAPWAIMSSYNLVNGVYAHENPHLLTDILREEWGFDGAVISDWGGSNDPVAAVRAGGTLEMPSPGFDSARAIVEAVESGTLPITELDARVAELIELVRRVTAHERARVDLTAHHELARRAAADSAVLLRNEGGILPLPAGTSIALIGAFATSPRYQGAGSSLVNSTQVPTLAEALTASKTVTIAGIVQGFRRDGTPDSSLIDEAVALAQRADVAVITLGLPDVAESEGLDRSSLALPEEQVRLLTEIHRVNAQTIVVLSAGGVVETPWSADAAALLHAYLGGQAGAEAIADILTGVADPAGRLAETMPLALADTPTAGVFPSHARTAEYREGPFVGYRYYETAGIAVAFPFGFGLGYTRFEYSDLAVDDSGAQLTVTNVGERAGGDVVQLYVGRADASAVARPVRELKGYAKVRLEPGEASRVSIPFDERTFRVFDTDGDCWKVEAGEYEIAVGGHLHDLPLRATVTRTGVTLTASAVPRAADGTDLRTLDDASFAAVLGRPIPDASWGTGPLGVNDPMDRLATARNPLARAAFRILDSRRRKAEAAGAPDLNILFLLNGPFRVISKMSGGLATGRLTTAVLTLVNGQSIRGLGRVVSAFFAGRREENATKTKFDSAAGERRA
ncbi:MAG: glycoside hydrolase family 3 C-terminal domain-containing protein [Microbacterium sp.]